MRRAEHEVARVLVVKEAGARLDEIVGEPQPVDQVQEALVAEVADRDPAHLDDELVERQLGGQGIHGGGLPPS